MANFKVRTEKFRQVCVAINLVGTAGFESLLHPSDYLDICYFFYLRYPQKYPHF